MSYFLWFHILSHLFLVLITYLLLLCFLLHYLQHLISLSFLFLPLSSSFSLLKHLTFLNPNIPVFSLIADSISGGNVSGLVLFYFIEVSLCVWYMSRLHVRHVSDTWTFRCTKWLWFTACKFLRVLCSFVLVKEVRFYYKPRKLLEKWKSRNKFWSCQISIFNIMDMMQNVISTAPALIVQTWTIRSALQ